MESVVIKLDLNDPYIAAGPCRNTVAVFSQWLTTPNFRDIWRTSADHFGDDLHRFVRQHTAATLDLSSASADRGENSQN